MTNEQKAKRIENIVKVVGLLILAFIVSPIIMATIKGLLGLVVAVAIGVVTLQFVPVVAMMIKNQKLKAIKAEANRNPVETLQNDYIKRENKLKEFRQSVVNFSGKIKDFTDRLRKFKNEHPEEAQKFREILEKMTALLQIRQGKLAQADKDLENYSEEIKKAGAIWEMGQAAAAMTEAAGMSEDDFLAQIAVDTSINAIQTNLNNAFAELEQSLLDEQALSQPKQISGQDTRIKVDIKASEPVFVNR